MTKPTTVVETLRAAMETIDSRNKWIKTDEARDQSNISVMPNDPTACKFCPVGALLHVLDSTGDDDDLPLYDQSLHVLAEVLRHDGRLSHRLAKGSNDFHVVTDFNDDPDTVHRDVVHIFVSALAAAEYADR